MVIYNTYYNRFKKEFEEQGLTSENIHLVKNETTVEDISFYCLHKALVQMMIEYINLHPLDNDVYTYSLNVDMVSGKWHMMLGDDNEININLPDSNYVVNSISGVENKKIVDSFDDLNRIIYFTLVDFIMRHTENINVKLTTMIFSCDDMKESLKENCWMSSMDSSLSIYSGDELIVCSM